MINTWMSFIGKKAKKYIILSMIQEILMIDNFNTRYMTSSYGCYVDYPLFFIDSFLDIKENELIKDGLVISVISDKTIVINIDLDHDKITND